MYQALAKVHGFNSNSSKWPQEVSSVNNPILQMSRGTRMQNKVPEFTRLPSGRAGIWTQVV